MVFNVELRPAPLYRRSPFQVAFLLFITSGLYIFYWAFKVRRYCEVTLEKPNESILKTIGLAILILNLFLIVDLGQLIKGIAFRAGTTVHGAIAMLGVVSVCLIACSRLPSPYWAISFFSFVPLTLLHFAFERAQLTTYGRAAMPQRFTWLEWLVTLLGSLWLILVLVGIALPKADGTYIPHFGYVYGIVALVVATLAIVKARSGELLSSFPGLPVAAQ